VAQDLRVEEPVTIVIFGASGDLTRRKLMPALYRQYRKGRLPGLKSIVGFSRTPYADSQFCRELRQGMEKVGDTHPGQEDWKDFSSKLHYCPGDANKSEDFDRLSDFLTDLEKGASNRLYYLATSPTFFPIIVRQLGQSGMASQNGAWRRVVVEKPFGRSLATAEELNQEIHRVFSEDQVYRIDHYLGKETAQNILYFRFLNTIFEPIWNRNFIDHVQITVAETVGVGHRGEYYDQAGVVRDMFQNHLLQLLSLVAMEPPARFEADAVRNEKVKLLRAIRPIRLKDTVRAQYEGYHALPGVAPNSQTPTYAALKLFVDNWRWQGVPFYLRSGKTLAERQTEIIIVFEPPPHVIFDLPADYALTPNFLSLCIQPDEGIHLRFETKVPDTPSETRSVDMEFLYKESFAGAVLPDAYERLLLDVMHGDASLFTRSDEIEMAWRVMDPVLEGWEGSPKAPHLGSYKPGSWGPQEAEDFMALDGRAWRSSCPDAP
jgi:glucose-6-phosphate 1-dehydrogenase